MVENSGLPAAGVERERLFSSDHPLSAAAGPPCLSPESVWSCVVISYRRDFEIFNGRDSSPEDSAPHGRCRWCATGAGEGGTVTSAREEHKQ